ncbi:MAG: M23 family metallopeptidase [Endomicrobium sp.]|nr:M23 family metallopeptidase [Endomicrobium sp.]
MKKFSKKTVVYFAVFAICLIVVIPIIRNRIADFEYPNPEIEIIEDAVSDVEKVIIQQGDILTLTLNNTKLSEKDTGEIIRELKKVMNIGRCMPGEFYEILYNKKTGNWTEFSYYPKGISYYSITRSSDNVITTEKKQLETTTTERKEQGTITSSLWSAMTSQDISQDIILSFADIFAWQIDFLTDTKQGDIFKLMYEVEYIAKKNKKLTSRIIVAQYQTPSRTYNAFYFKTKEGEDGYFDENGKSVKSTFLKAPLQFRRISSIFTTSRVHPILKYARPHLGIDYAAPEGTPVSSVGNGTIVKAQYSGGFGKLVIIKHSNGCETYYGHLSKYGKGIKKGAKVKQGQVIGYVGMTGLATGPHLDFRIKLNGKFFDFQKMKRSPSTVLTGEDKKAFMEKIQTIELI